LLIAYQDVDVSTNKGERTFAASLQTMLIQHSIWPIWGFMKATVGFLIYGFTLIHLQEDAERSAQYVIIESKHL